MARNTPISRLKDKVRKALPKIKTPKLNRSEKIAAVGTAISVATAVYALSKDSNNSGTRSANVTGLDSVSTQALVEAVKNSPELISLLRGFAGSNGANGSNGTNGENAFIHLPNENNFSLSSSIHNGKILFVPSSSNNLLTLNCNSLTEGNIFILENAKSTSIGVEKSDMSTGTIRIIPAKTACVVKILAGTDIEIDLLKGTNGTKIKTGTNHLDFTDANTGDMYLNISTYNLWKYTSAIDANSQFPVWDDLGTLKGTNGSFTFTNPILVTRSGDYYTFKFNGLNQNFINLTGISATPNIFVTIIKPNGQGYRGIIGAGWNDDANSTSFDCNIRDASGNIIADNSIFNDAIFIVDYYYKETLRRILDEGRLYTSDGFATNFHNVERVIFNNNLANFVLPNSTNNFLYRNKRYIFFKQSGTSTTITDANSNNVIFTLATLGTIAPNTHHQIELFCDYNGSWFIIGL